MDTFFGRERELALLERQRSGPASAFVPIYGRRRVGKTELIRRFLSGKRAVLYLGKQAPAGLQRRELLRVAARAFDEPLLASAGLDTWRDVLATVVERGCRQGKVVLALDEFQWMAAASPELPSVLQELWDLSWRDDGRVMLILCGSYIGFMEREVLGERSPLFGRRTSQILLKPFDFREARAFHPRCSLADAVRTWSVCGGIPAYLRTFDDELSVPQNLRAVLLDEGGALRREPEFLLREGLRDVSNYHAVLMGLAEGKTRATDLARATGLGRSLSYHLDQLVALGYVRRRYPTTGRPPAARHVRFVLADPLLAFWFRFVFPNESLLASLGPTAVFDTVVQPALPAWYGGRFEQLCRDALPALYAAEGVTSPFEVGEYWDKHVQIDVVGVRRDGRVDLGECRWGAIPSWPGLLAELQRRRSRFPNPEGSSITLRAFARRAPEAPPPGFRVHDLASLYGERSGSGEQPPPVG